MSSTSSDFSRSLSTFEAFEDKLSNRKQSSTSRRQLADTSLLLEELKFLLDSVEELKERYPSESSDSTIKCYNGGQSKTIF
mmetsp:Transcript_19433/g.29872  ORF Transcript_19433/g.29872 Transcript_19433/m.29872 type:complete len:81 (-) Transcript_19433:869-1111(-)